MPILCHFGKPNGPDVDISTKNSKNDSGSKETTQNPQVVSFLEFFLNTKFFEIEFLLSPEKKLYINILRSNLVE